MATMSLRSGSVLAVLEHGVELGRQDRIRFEELPRIVDRN